MLRWCCFRPCGTSCTSGLGWGESLCFGHLSAGASIAHTLTWMGTMEAVMWCHRKCHKCPTGVDTAVRKWLVVERLPSLLDNGLGGPLLPCCCMDGFGGFSLPCWGINGFGDPSLLHYSRDRFSDPSLPHWCMDGFSGLSLPRCCKGQALCASPAVPFWGSCG